MKQVELIQPNELGNRESPQTEKIYGKTAIFSYLQHGHPSRDSRPGHDR
jgi:hypothetical protein